VRENLGVASLTVPVGPEDHVLGLADAPLVLVMYGDFECPYCAAAQGVVRRVRGRLEGRLAFVFRHLPIAARHPHAELAAQASEAAAAQGEFWAYHDALYAARGRLGLEDLVAHAERLGLDSHRLHTEVESSVHLPRIWRDTESAVASGATGTPAFFANGTLVEGAFDAGSLVEALEAWEV